ncbi:hypothetical protein OH77DRAFT_1437204 [Trametes cingulata]|nr:hypothetical protein OH77DRAFT_1437204 [Trametes cingulata]
MSHTGPSDSSLSLPTTEQGSATPASSTTALVPKRPVQPVASANTSPKPAPTKNYEEAFAALSSSYGFGGTVPTKNPKQKTKHEKMKKKERKSPAATPPAPAQGSPNAGGS